MKLINSRMLRLKSQSVRILTPFETMVSKRRSSWIYFLISMLGLLWQTNDISEIYFKYETITQLNIESPDRILPPSFTVCFEMKYFKSSDKNGDFFKTSANAFNATPPVDERFFYRCSLHVPNSFKRIEFEFNQSNTCYHYFKVQKFVKQGKVCYTIQLREKRFYWIRHVGNSLEYPILYYATLRYQLLDHKFYFYYLQPYGRRLFGTTQSFSEQYRHLLGGVNKGLGLSNAVTVTYKTLISKKLKSPYDTNCFNYKSIGYESRFHCLDSCMIEKSKMALNRLPFETTTFEVSNVSFLSYSDLDNVTIVAKMDDIRQNCLSQCSRPDCFSEEIIPKYIGTEMTPHMYFTVYPPDEPNLINIHFAKCELIDFLTLNLSSISFWFGWSPFYFLLKTKLFDRFFVRNRRPRVVSPRAENTVRYEKNS